MMTASGERDHWSYKLIEHLKGNQTLDGAIVIAIIGKAPSNPPRILCGAVVDAAGRLSTYAETRQKPGVEALIDLGPIENVLNTFRRYCDEVKLDDAAREEFFAEFRKWIIKDWRVLTDHPTLQ